MKTPNSENSEKIQKLIDEFGNEMLIAHRQYINLSEKIENSPLNKKREDFLKLKREIEIEYDNFSVVYNFIQKNYENVETQRWFHNGFRELYAIKACLLCSINDEFKDK